ncbi:MAG: LacI family DNA-binding transcriptional regulator [Alkalispirochaeta sp.]
MAITRDDVARRAGVSTATVSYVVNNSRSVGAETRARVLAAVEELRYQPNIVARSLASNKTWQLGIAVGDISNPFFGEIVLGFEEAAQERGYFVNIISAAEGLDRYLQHIISRRIDGLFVVALPTRFDTELLYRLVDAEVPVVVSGNRTVDPAQIGTIENDYPTAMEEAFTLLRGFGHRRIAYFSGLPVELTFDNRVAAYRDCVTRHRLGDPEALLFRDPAHATTSMDDGKALAQRFIAASDPGRPAATAVICTNAMMALGALPLLQDAGYRVPDDLSVLAFDNIFAEELVRPRLSCFDMRKREFGRRAFEMLAGEITGDSPQHVINPLSYIPRESVGPAPEERAD